MNSLELAEVRLTHVESPRPAGVGNDTRGSGAKHVPWHAVVSLTRLHPDDDIGGASDIQFGTQSASTPRSE